MPQDTPSTARRGLMRITRADVLCGVVVPVLCLALDSYMFKGYSLMGLSYDALFGDQRVFVYLVAGLGIALFIGQKQVEPLARYAWLWAPCFILGGLGALGVAIPAFVLGALMIQSHITAIVSILLGHANHATLQTLLQSFYLAFTSVLGLSAWVPALLYLRTGWRSVKGAFRPVWRVLAALAFGVAVFGVPALVNRAAQDFIDRRVDVILTGPRAEAVASAYSLKAAFWCDAGCLHRLSRAYDAARGEETEADARWVLVAECFRIVTGEDIKQFHLMGI